MLKRLLAALLAFLAVTVFAADANTASQADLEAIKGIGPAIATRIIDERRNGNFKDWSDLVNRVKGIGATSAGKLSTAGLTVNGTPYGGAVAPAPAPAKAPTPAARPTTAPAAAAPAPAPAPAPAAPASTAKELKKAAAARKKADKAAAAASPASAANAGKK